ncbi:MAG TPA: sulfurtransferase [Casimicrobiaceae bacterium]|nr:sulfurtransferase [Casimicrobiaceae bacterium]
MYSTLISTDELAARLEDPSVVIVDARYDLRKPDAGEVVYAEGHIPGARFVHLDRDLSAPKTGRNGRHPLPAPEAAADVFGRLGIDASKQVVVYDGGDGVFASRVWWMLRWLDHHAAAVLDGGYAKWTREGRPTTTESPNVKAARFEVGRVAPTVSATGVAASIPRHTLVLMDARAAERFRGDVETIDPVAGHIPGAINRPSSRNLGADGSFRNPRDLREQFEGMLHGRSVDDVVHYCGSGVSACHNILAMAIAGYPLTRLYPGSWSEWSADGSRPVAKGER